MSASKNREMVCDFCSSLEPTYVCPARSFEMGVLNTASDGAWLACEECAKLVKSGDRSKLAHRTAEKMPKGGIPFKLTLDVVTGIQGDFWRNRDGPVRKATNEELESLKQQKESYLKLIPGLPPPPPNWLEDIKNDTLKGRYGHLAFSARYSGKCGLCDKEIDIGDSVIYIDDEICHSSCAEEEGYEIIPIGEDLEEQDYE